MGLLPRWIVGSGMRLQYVAIMLVITAMGLAIAVLLPIRQEADQVLLVRVRNAISQDNEQEALSLIGPLLAERSSPQVADLCMALAEMLTQGPNYKRAEQLLERALDIRTEQQGEDSIPVADASFRLGLFYVLDASLEPGSKQSQGRLLRAEGLFEDAFNIRTKTGAAIVFGGEADLLRQLNVVCLLSNDLDETQCPENAERLKRIAEIGGTAPMFTTEWSAALYELADSYDKKKEYRKSLELRTQVLDRVIQQYGRHDSRVAQALRLIAPAYGNLALWSQAVSALEEVVSIMEQDAGVVSISDLESLADAYAHDGQFGQATATMAQAIDIQRKQFGPDSTMLLPLLSKYAQLLNKAGRSVDSQVVSSEIAKLKAGTAVSSVRRLSEVSARSLEEAIEKFGVRPPREDVAKDGSFGVRCGGVRVERENQRGDVAILYQAVGDILSCDVDENTGNILVATTGKVVILSAQGELLEDSEDEPGTISSAGWGGSTAVVISLDYSRYDQDNELVLVKDGRFVAVLGHVPSHSVLTELHGRLVAVAPPDEQNVSCLYEVIVPQ